MKDEGTLSLHEDGEDLPQTEMPLAAPWWKRRFQNRSPAAAYCSCRFPIEIANRE
jgi:hypothetical protein